MRNGIAVQGPALQLVETTVQAGGVTPAHCAPSATPLGKTHETRPVRLTLTHTHRQTSLCCGAVAAADGDPVERSTVLSIDTGLCR